MVDDDAKFRLQLNNALDGNLSENELDTFQSDLEEAPEKVDHWDRLHKTDELLRTTPLEAPSPGFANRVMTAISTMHLRDLSNGRFGLSLAIGLLVVGLLTVPLFSAALILLISVLANPATLHALFELGTHGAGTLIGLAADLEDGLQAVVTDTPIVPALLTTVIPMSILWVWLVWYLSSGRHLRASRQIV